MAVLAFLAAGAMGAAWAACDPPDPPAFEPKAVFPTAQIGRSESGPVTSADGLHLYYNADPGVGSEARIYTVARASMSDCWGPEAIACGCVNDGAACHPAPHPDGQHLYYSTDPVGQFSYWVADMDPSTGCWINCRPTTGLGKLPRLFRIGGETWAFFSDSTERNIVRAIQADGDPATFVNPKLLSLSSTPPLKQSATLCVGSMTLYYDQEESSGTDQWDVYATCYDEAADDFPPGSPVPGLAAPGKDERQISLSPTCCTMYFKSGNLLRPDPGRNDIYWAGPEVECPGDPGQCYADGSCEEVMAKLEEVDGKVDAVEAKLDLMEPKLDSMEPTLDGLGDALEIQEQKLDSLQSKSDATVTGVDALEAKADQAEDSLETLDDKADSLDSKVDRLEVKADTAEQKLDSIEGNTDALGQDVGRLEAKTDAAEGKLDALAARVDGLGTEVARLEAKADSAENRLERIESLVNEILVRLPVDLAGSLKRLEQLICTPAGRRDCWNPGKD